MAKSNYLALLGVAFLGARFDKIRIQCKPHFQKQLRRIEGVIKKQTGAQGNFAAKKIDRRLWEGRGHSRRRGNDREERDEREAHEDQFAESQGGSRDTKNVVGGAQAKLTGYTLLCWMPGAGQWKWHVQPLDSHTVTKYFIAFSDIKRILSPQSEWLTDTSRIYSHCVRFLYSVGTLFSCRKQPSDIYYMLVSYSICLCLCICHSGKSMRAHN